MTWYVGVAKGIIVLIGAMYVPAIFIVTLDLLFGTNLFDIYLPLIGLAINLTGLAFIPMAVGLDIILNLSFDLLRALGINITVKSNMAEFIPQVIEIITLSIAILGINYAKVATGDKSIAETVSVKSFFGS